MPNPNLERLERMAHAEKIMHWRGEKPWAGFRLPLIKQPFPPNRITVDDLGNITDMPLLIGRPCFGQPTAFMRHGGGNLVFNPRTRSWGLDRCGRCPVRKACEFVCKKRLRATPEIDATYQEWEHLGGRDATWGPQGKRGTAAVILRDLLHLLSTQVQFQSVNDGRVREHYDALLSKRRAIDAARQRRRRLNEQLQRARAGEFDPSVLDALSRHRTWRQVEHMKARNHPAGPRQLKKAQETVSLFDSRVWLAKTRIELGGKEANDSNVAREMQSLGFETHRSHGALRDAVRRALTRIALLEVTHLPGCSDPIWPPFGERELRDDLSFNPLQGLAA